MLTNIVWFSLVMSALSWFLFVYVAIWFDLPRLREATAPGGPLTRTEMHAGVDEVAKATGTLAGAFKAAGVAPTAAAMSVLFMLLALVAAGIAKF
jgi:hypothetical protein